MSFTRTIIKAGAEARVAELHAAIDTAEAAIRALQQEGVQMAAERARFQWELGEGPASEPGTHSVLFKLGEIRLELARKPGSPKPSAQEATLARRADILRGAIAALGVAPPTGRMVDAETRRRVLLDELGTLEVLAIDMGSPSR